MEIKSNLPVVGTMRPSAEMKQKVKLTTGFEKVGKTLISDKH